MGQSREADDIVMPYGAFKGKPMHKIPSGYLHWLAEISRMRTSARQQTRNGNGGKNTGSTGKNENQI